jgi:hypothetical protein
MEGTTAQEVYDSFESSFRDKEIIPDTLELVWLKKAVARYSTELEPISFSEEEMAFDEVLDQYAIDTLAAFMKQLYQEREVSKVNKRVSIVSKDLSIDGNGNGKVASRTELEYDSSKSEYMVQMQKPTAYD